MNGISESSVLSKQVQVTTKLICKESEWDAIQVEWNQLFDKSPYSAPPLHFDWLRGWWRIYGPKYGAGGLQIITVWSESQLIGALPLYICRGKGGVLGFRTLRFISTGEDEYEETCPDYMNLLCVPGEEIYIVSVVWGEIAKMAWDQLELLDLPQTSPLLHFQSAQTFSRGTCAVSNFANGFEAYLAELSANSRKNARRYLREFDSDAVTFEIIEQSSATQTFNDLMQLHQERWTAEGKPGVFSAQRFVDFHKNIIRDWLPVGKALLARLSYDNIPVAIIYGYVNNQKCDLYQCGVKRDILSIRSPGNLAHLLFMKTLAERGITQYDFLRGSSAYKVALANEETSLVGLRIWRRTPRTFLYHLVEYSRKVCSKCIKFLNIR